MIYLFVAFLLFPLAELFLMIKVGSLVGAGTTVFLVLLTAFVGALLVRIQGLSTFHRARVLLADNQLPAIEMLEGVFILAAGVLLLVPGFVTDAAGFFLLVPRLRHLVALRCVQRGVVPSVMHARQARVRDEESGQHRIIDAEFRDIDR